MRKILTVMAACALLGSCCSSHISGDPLESGPVYSAKKVVLTGDAPAPDGPYSQAVYAEGTLYVSGQLPLDPKTGIMPEGIEAQTRQCLENVGAVLKAAGLGYIDVVKVTVLLSDISNLSKMDKVYAGYFPSESPARVCYEVSALSGGADVQMDVTAVYTNPNEPDMAGE